MSTGSDQRDARIAEAARSFDAELHGSGYAKIHADDAQLARLLDYISPEPGQVILDLGTGNGYAATALAGRQPACHVIGVDVAAQAIATNRRKVREQDIGNAEFVSYGGIDLPFDTDCFDAAVCRYAFHHLPRPETSLDELGRTLRTGGRLALADAIRDDVDEGDFVNRFQTLKRDGHVCMQRRADLTELVERHGFEVQEVFETAIAFTRDRATAYDELLRVTPESVLEAYAVAVEARLIRIGFRILNLLMVNRRS